eukprot:1142377-Pelagomonas_calceolata.AAC.5
MQVLSAFNGGRITMFGKHVSKRWLKLDSTAVRCAAYMASTQHEDAQHTFTHNMDGKHVSKEWLKLGSTAARCTAGMASTQLEDAQHAWQACVQAMAEAWLCCVDDAHQVCRSGRGMVIRACGVHVDDELWVMHVPGLTLCTNILVRRIALLLIASKQHHTLSAEKQDGKLFGKQYSQRSMLPLRAAGSNTLALSDGSHGWPEAGNNTLALSDGNHGWSVGDRLLVPSSTFNPRQH